MASSEGGLGVRLDGSHWEDKVHADFVLWHLFWGR